jgi:hypothetical protein
MARHSKRRKQRAGTPSKRTLTSKEITARRKKAAPKKTGPPVRRVHIEQLTTFCQLCSNTGKRMLHKDGKDVLIDCDHDGMILVASEDDPRNI